MENKDYIEWINTLHSLPIENTYVKTFAGLDEGQIEVCLWNGKFFINNSQIVFDITHWSPLN